MLSKLNLENFKDPYWRLNKLYQIVNKKSQRIKFKENSIQKIINKSTSKRKIILKARQFGITTNEVIKLLDYTMFNRNVTTCILAHENDAIKKIFRIVRRAYKYMPELLKPQLDKGGGSKYEMFFPSINSLIYCDLESRGDTINHLHISEAAFMDYERFLSTLQAVPLDGYVTIESTANGIESFFYDIWTDTDDSYSIYEKIFLPWFYNPEYEIPTNQKLSLSKEEEELKRRLKKQGIELSDAQINFRRFKQKELKEKFIQEYPEDDMSCFLHSGRTVVDQQLFQTLINKAIAPLREEEGLVIFEERDPKKDYVIGADVAQGVGGDWSVAIILCVQTMEEVGFFRRQISPFQFAKKLKAIADFFSTGFRVPLLAVESNNHGHAVLLELVENIGYPNLFYAKDGQPGWITNSITRPIMIDQVIEAASEETVKFNSKETLQEMRLLTEVNGKIQAPANKHDDCVFAAAIAVQMLLESSTKIKLYENVGQDIMMV